MFHGAARVALALACAACGSDTRPARRVTLMPDSLRVELRAPGAAPPGAAVPVTLRLTNLADHSVEAHFLGREIAFDIVVLDEQDAVVWRRLEGRTVPSILQIRMLAAGEKMEWSDVWVPKATGRYRIQGLLPSDDPEPRRTPWLILDVR